MNAQKTLTIATDVHTYISMFIATCSFPQRHQAHKEANQYLFSPKWSRHVPICGHLLLLCFNTPPHSQLFTQDKKCCFPELCFFVKQDEEHEAGFSWVNDQIG